MACVIFQVSEPYRSVAFTVVKMRSLVLVEIDEAFHTVLRMLNTSLALPILLFTSLSVTPVPMILPRSLNEA